MYQKYRCQYIQYITRTADARCIMISAHCNTLQHTATHCEQCVAVCCSVLQLDIVCWYTYIPCVSSACYTLCVSIVCQQCVAVCCSALHCVSVCCSFDVVCLYRYTVHQQCVLYIVYQHCVLYNQSQLRLRASVTFCCCIFHQSAPAVCASAPAVCVI